MAICFLVSCNNQDYGIFKKAFIPGQKFLVFPFRLPWEKHITDSLMNSTNRLQI